MLHFKVDTRQLLGYQRVTLAPHEKKTVTVELPVEKLARWDESAKAFSVEPGVYEVLIGASSADIRAESKVTTLHSTK